MATKKKIVTKPATLALATIVESTVKSGFLNVTVDEATPFVDAGFAEANPEGPNADGKIAIRATQKGIDEMTKTNPATVTEKTETKSAFAIEDNVPLPAITGRGGRIGSSVYPFEKLGVNQSFFVPNSEGKPEAAKAMASTVSSANRRYAVAAADGSTKTNKAGETVPVMVKTREFVVRAVQDGARIWRTK